MLSFHQLWRVYSASLRGRRRSRLHRHGHLARNPLRLLGPHPPTHQCAWPSTPTVHQTRMKCRSGKVRLPKSFQLAKMLQWRDSIPIHPSLPLPLPSSSPHSPLPPTSLQCSSSPSPLNPLFLFHPALLPPSLPLPPHLLISLPLSLIT